MFRKIIVSFLLATILFVSVSTTYAYAQETNPWYMQTFNQWYTKVYDTNVSPPQEIFGERYTAAQVYWVVYGLISFILNIDGNTQRMACLVGSGDVGTCLEQNPLFSYNTQPIPQKQESALALIFSKERDLSGVNYIRGKLVNLKIIPETQAQGLEQGFGFTALNPVQRIWKAFRNIMYGFFVLIIIVYAFLVMFRAKISPQTAITVQSAIPKIIITLILVTFSYAIAGLLVDLMYVVIGLVALVFSNIGLFSGPNTWSTIFNIITLGPGRFAYGILGWFILYTVSFVAVLAGAIFSANGIVQVAGAVIGFIIGIVLLVGVVIWLFITIIKVFVILIKAYLTILISVIFAPLMIGFGAITPTGGFSSWLKGLISNLLVYPITGALLLLAILFLSATNPVVRVAISLGLGGGIDVQSPFDQPAGTSYWYPPLTLGSQSGSWDPLPILWLFTSLSILAMIPKVVDIIKGAMAGKGIEGGMSGIGTAFGAIGGYALATPRLALERRVMTREAWRQSEIEARQKGYKPPTEVYLPEKRTEFLRRTGLYKR